MPDSLPFSAPPTEPVLLDEAGARAPWSPPTRRSA